MLHLLLPLLLATQQPTAPGDSAAYVLVLGRDTLATERRVRSAERVEGEMRLVRGAPQRLLYTWTLDAGGVVREARWEVYVGGDSVPQVQGTARFAGDSVSIDDGRGAPVRRAARAGTVPFFNPSFVAVEQILLRARALGGDSVAVPVLGLVGGQPFEGVVRWLGRDSAEVLLASVPALAAIDARGALRGASVPSQQLRVVRVPWGSAAAPGAAPDYGAPADAPYVARDVRIPTSAGHALAGTLTMPKVVSGPVPAVITISGSGPQDRDERLVGVPGYAIFRQVADTLGRRGIAVLRVDDRGTGGSGGRFAGATSADFAADVRAALAWLRTQPGIDPARVALLGHSEGAMVAPLVAAADSGVAALVLLAAPGRGGREILAAQLRGGVERDTTLPAARRDSLLQRSSTVIDSLERADPWMRWWFAHDPLATARQVRQPVLLLHGATDRQVDPADAERLAAALREGGNADVTVRVLPDANHLFLHDPSGDPSGYVRLRDTRVLPAALGAIADWLAARLGA